MFEPFESSAALAAVLAGRGRRSPFPKAGDRARWEALPGEITGQLIAWGDEARADYPMLAASQFMAFARSGDRETYETPYFQRRERLMGAALAECARHEGSYLDAVIDGLWCICEESSWVISAHNGSSHEGMSPPRERPLPDIQNPYIDLFAAQTAATLSHIVYLLEDELDAVSPLITRRVRLELERRIFLPFLTRDDFWWMGMIRKDLNNWTPWILSNIIDSMLLMMDDDQRLARGLGRAMAMLDRYLRVMPEDGGCDEGVSYWNMAGGSLLDCLESLNLATEGKIDLFSQPKIRAIGRFPLKAHIDGPWYWNFADCDAKPRLDGEPLYCWGMRIEDEELKALGLDIMKKRNSVRPADTPQMNRVLWALFIAQNAESPVQSEGISDPVRRRPFTALPDTQVFAWRKGGWYAAVKGGHNGESHNHNDVGSFILYLEGRPQIVDAGNLCYTAKTFGPERYTLWNTRSMYHNLPMVWDIEQREGRAYAAQVLEADERGARLELAGAYPAEAGIGSFIRCVELSADGLALRDRITLGKEADMTWVFMLTGKPRCDEEAGIIEAGGIVIFYPPNAGYHEERIPVTDPRLARNFDTLWRVCLRWDEQREYDVKFIVERR